MAAKIVAGVFAADGIDRIGTEFAGSGGFSNGLFNLPFHEQLISPARCMDKKGWHTGILADRRNVVNSHINIDRDS